MSSMAAAAGCGEAVLHSADQTHVAQQAGPMVVQAPTGSYSWPEQELENADLVSLSAVPSALAEDIDIGTASGQRKIPLGLQPSAPMGQECHGGRYHATEETPADRQGLLPQGGDKHEQQCLPCGDAVAADRAGVAAASKDLSSILHHGKRRHSVAAHGQQAANELRGDIELCSRSTCTAPDAATVAAIFATSIDLSGHATEGHVLKAPSAISELRLSSCKTTAQRAAVDFFKGVPRQWLQQLVLSLPIEGQRTLLASSKWLARQVLTSVQASLTANWELQQQLSQLQSAHKKQGSLLRMVVQEGTAEAAAHKRTLQGLSTLQLLLSMETADAQLAVQQLANQPLPQGNPRSQALQHGMQGSLLVNMIASGVAGQGATIAQLQTNVATLQHDKMVLTSQLEQARSALSMALSLMAKVGLQTRMDLQQAAVECLNIISLTLPATASTGSNTVLKFAQRLALDVALLKSKQSKELTVAWQLVPVLKRCAAMANAPLLKLDNSGLRCVVEQHYNDGVPFVQINSKEDRQRYMHREQQQVQAVVFSQPQAVQPEGKLAPQQGPSPLDREQLHMLVWAANQHAALAFDAAAADEQVAAMHVVERPLPELMFGSLGAELPHNQVPLSTSIESHTRQVQVQAMAQYALDSCDVMFGSIPKQFFSDPNFRQWFVSSVQDPNHPTPQRQPTRTLAAYLRYMASIRRTHLTTADQDVLLLERAWSSRAQRRQLAMGSSTSSMVGIVVPFVPRRVTVRRPSSVLAHGSAVDAHASAAHQLLMEATRLPQTWQAIAAAVHATRPLGTFAVIRLLRLAIADGAQLPLPLPQAPAMRVRAWQQQQQQGSLVEDFSSSSSNTGVNGVRGVRTLLPPIAAAALRLPYTMPTPQQYRRAPVTSPRQQSYNAAPVHQLVKDWQADDRMPLTGSGISLAGKVLQGGMKAALGLASKMTAMYTYGLHPRASWTVTEGVSSCVPAISVQQAMLQVGAMTKQGARAVLPMPANAATADTWPGGTLHGLVAYAVTIAEVDAAHPLIVTETASGQQLQQLLMDSQSGGQCAAPAHRVVSAERVFHAGVKAAMKLATALAAAVAPRGRMPVHTAQQAMPQVGAIENQPRIWRGPARKQGGGI